MTPPKWLDESGQRRPVHPCELCGPEAPIFRLSLEHLRLVGWRLFAAASHTNRCGHWQEFVLVPDDDCWCRIIPELNEAA